MKDIEKTDTTDKATETEETDELIECDECGATEAVSETEYTRESAEGEGWYFRISTKRTLCPECNCTGA